MHIALAHVSMSFLAALLLTAVSAYDHKQHVDISQGGAIHIASDGTLTTNDGPVSPTTKATSKTSMIRTAKVADVVHNEATPQHRAATATASEADVDLGAEPSTMRTPKASDVMPIAAGVDAGVESLMVRTAEANDVVPSEAGVHVPIEAKANTRSVVRSSKAADDALPFELPAHTSKSSMIRSAKAPSNVAKLVIDTDASMDEVDEADKGEFQRGDAVGVNPVTEEELTGLGLPASMMEMGLQLGSQLGIDAYRVLDASMGAALIIPDDYPYVCQCNNEAKCEKDSMKTPCPLHRGVMAGARRMTGAASIFAAVLFWALASMA